jgi:protein-L-isoaspartate(D-aspartate) O-methyltransferase
MTELAAVTSESVVLEVGTGSGYQAAILSELASHVYSIEIVEPLGLEAKSLLQDLAYDNVTVKIGDGYHGWPEHAPFDAILVTAAAEYVPEQLIQQLKPGGRLVIPVGKQGQTQSLRVLMKGANGEIKQRDILSVAFVPLTGKH